MTDEEFLPIANIRTKVGTVVDGAQDALLMTYRAAAIEKIENLTRRNILDRTVTAYAIRIRPRRHDYAGPALSSLRCEGDQGVHA